MLRVFRHIVLFFGPIMISLALPYNSSGFSVDYSLGFNGHFQLNNWTPLSIVIDNRGRAISGTLEIIATSGSEYQGDVYRTVYTTEVDLPQNSKKQYPFTIILKSFSHDLIIRLRQDNATLFSRTINLRPHFTEKKFIVVAENYVAPDILSVLPDQLHPANVRPHFLPETDYGYDSVKLLILQADTIRQLRDRQYQALSRWVAQGGYLVLGAGLNFGSLGNPRLQDLLPIRISGHQQLSEIKSLGEFCSRELTGNEPFLVLNARVDDSRILLKEKDIPIITRKKLGFGYIVFLSFDFNSPPFSHWDGRRLFWNKILSLQPEIDRPLLEEADQQIVSSMFAGIPGKFPDYGSVVIFVGAYLIFLWFLLKKIKKPGKSRWQYSLYLMLMIILFTAIGYRGFYYPNLNQKFSYNSFCQIDVADTHAPAAVRNFIGLYSLENLAFALNFKPYSYSLTHIVSEKSPTKIPSPYVVQIKDGGQHILGSLQRWSHIFYRLNLHLASPLAGDARRDNSFLTLEIENRLPDDLVDCLVYYRKRFLFVEDILAGHRQSIKIDLAKLKKIEIFSKHSVDAIMRRFDGNGSAAYLRVTQRHLTPDLLLEIHEKYRSSPDSIILVGWMPAGLIQPHFNHTNPPGAGVTLISWKLPVEIAL